MAFLDFLKVQKQGLEGLASVGVIGMHMVSGPLVGLAIGYFLDRWLETGPWLKLIFLVIGIGAGFLNVYMDTKILVKRLDKQGRAPVEASRETCQATPGDAPRDSSQEASRRQHKDDNG